MNTLPISLRRLPPAAIAAVMVAVGPVHSADARAGTPSFLCSKATTWVETTICSSARLSALDLELASVYANLLRTATPKSEPALTASQQRWWSSRDECRKHSTGIDCLDQRYVQRIAALKARPDYSAQRPVRNVELPPEPLSAVGEGWSKSLSRYVKAIRACLSKAPAPVRWVANAWDDTTYDEAVAMKLRGPDRHAWLCTARRNGLEVLAWHDIADQDDTLAEGPLFYPGAVSPAHACGKPLKVLDESDVHIGWLGPACAVVGSAQR